METVAKSPTPAMQRSSKSIMRWFPIGLAIAIIVLSIAGFAPSLIDTSGRNVPLPLTPIVMLHAILGSTFLLLFLAQTTLVSASRISAHRKLGIVAVIVAFAFVATGFLTDIQQVQRGFDLSGDITFGANSDQPITSLGPAVLFAVFGLLVIAGIVFRRRPEVHKRLMLIAVIAGLWGTPLGHLLGRWEVSPLWTIVIQLGSWLLLLTLLAGYDRAMQGRIHPVTLYVGALALVFPILFLGLVAPSSAWQQFSTWLISQG
jgi:hypothetical protein